AAPAPRARSRCATVRHLSRHDTARTRTREAEFPRRAQTHLRHRRAEGRRAWREDSGTHPGNNSQYGRMNPPEDLDKLAAALGGSAGGLVRAGSSLMVWLEAMAERHASDLLLLAGEPPAFQIDGRIVRSESSVLDGDDVAELVLPELAPHAQQ